MTEPYEPQGPLHTGSGDQYIGPTVVNQHFAEATYQDPDIRWTTPTDDLVRLKQRFAPPPNLSNAREKLRENHTVLLTAIPGSGRHAAAQMLLNELAGNAGPISDLIDEADHLSSRLSPARIEDRQRLLLDLSDSDEQTLHARQQELPAFRAKIQERNAYLVIVLPHTLAHQVHAELSRHVATIDRPRGQVVLQRHLAAEGIELTEADLNSEALAPHLDGAMREIAALADAVVKARDQDRQGGSSSWLKEALAETSDRQREAADQVKTRQTGRERAVLLSVAMLGRASTDSVFFASQRLLDLVNTTVEKPRLEQIGHLEQLKELVKDVQAHHYVQFDRPEYDRAMRRHFWDNYPDLRQSFSVWVGETLKVDHLNRADRRTLVGRYVEEALRTGSIEDLTALINRWANPTKSNGPSYWIEFATKALIAGLNDARHGKKFRALVYQWSTTDLPEHVGQLLVQVCTDVIAPVYPEQALVRLHQRSRRESGNGNPTARSALLRLISHNRTLFRLLLDRLATSLCSQKWPTDFSLFLDAADPSWLIGTESRSRPLAADMVVREQLIDGWHAILIHRPDLAWPAVRRWLQVAGQTTSAELLLGILVESAQHDVGLLSALYVVARDWNQQQSGLRNVIARLSQLIDAAQGIYIEDLTHP